MDLSLTLQSILDTARTPLEALTDEQVKTPRSPGKWSPIQIIGHLCDSAINNVGRIIHAQETDELIFDGYSQDFWVEANDYQNANWSSILELFFHLNHRMSEIVKNIPEETLNLPRKKHNITPPSYAYWEPYELPTLGFWIRDYMGHMEHHLKQILPDYEPVVWNH
ncbi:DinB family protein [Marinoscillum sp. MHG1-6]|uniref:DinB family protein n=1 Tax=Marinoscillum sp. MHG1-6 TaxID=2959627 RepID=UPI002157BCD7|nr:DinB family protein [Marinoscillum sp. MHG1-6]